MRNVGDQLLHLLFRLQAFLRLPLLYMLDPGQLFIYLPGKGILCLLIFFQRLPRKESIKVFLQKLRKCIDFFFLPPKPKKRKARKKQGCSRDHCHPIH